MREAEERSNAELLAELEDMLDGLDAEDVDMEAVARSLSLLDERAPVAERDEREEWEKLEAKLFPGEAEPEPGRSRRGPRRLRLLLIAAAVAALLLGAFGAAYAASPALRWFLSVEARPDGGAVVSMEEASPTPEPEPTVLDGFLLPALPEGYIETERSAEETAARARYEGADGTSIEIEVRRSSRRPGEKRPSPESILQIDASDAVEWIYPDLAYTHNSAGQDRVVRYFHNAGKERYVLVSTEGLDRGQTLYYVWQISRETAE